MHVHTSPPSPPACAPPLANARSATSKPHPWNHPVRTQTRQSIGTIFTSSPVPGTWRSWRARLLALPKSGGFCGTNMSAPLVQGADLSITTVIGGVVRRRSVACGACRRGAFSGTHSHIRRGGSGQGCGGGCCCRCGAVGRGRSRHREVGGRVAANTNSSMGIGSRRRIRPLMGCAGRGKGTTVGDGGDGLATSKGWL